MKTDAITYEVIATFMTGAISARSKQRTDHESRTRDLPDSLWTKWCVKYQKIFKYITYFLWTMHYRTLETCTAQVQRRIAAGMHCH